MVNRLAQATSMYELVKGTSSSSRYVVVALGSVINVAARWAGGAGGLSIRVESPSDNHEDIQQAVAGVGLQISDKHASIHIGAVNSQETAAKALGAVLMALKDHFTTILPDMSQVAGKGK